MAWVRLRKALKRSTFDSVGFWEQLSEEQRKLLNSLCKAQMTQGDEDPLRKPGETILKPNLSKPEDKSSHQ